VYQKHRRESNFRSGGEGVEGVEDIEIIFLFKGSRMLDL
jgi:hypothetical protein